MAADNDEEARPAAKSSSWNPLGGLFADGDAKPPAKSDSAKKGAASKDAKKRLGRIDAALALRDQEMANLLRRQDVCLKLHRIAGDTNDPELDRVAWQLEQKAWDLYRERTKDLPGANASLQDDEKRLEQRLPVQTSDSASAAGPGQQAGHGQRPQWHRCGAGGGTMKTGFWIAALLGAGQQWLPVGPEIHLVLGKNADLGDHCNQDSAQPHTPAVRPDQVTEDNGWKMAQALGEEIEAEKNKPLPGTRAAISPRSTAGSKASTADR